MSGSAARCGSQIEAIGEGNDGKLGLADELVGRGPPRCVTCRRQCVDPGTCPLQLDVRRVCMTRDRQKRTCLWPRRQPNYRDRSPKCIADRPVAIQTRSAVRVVQFLECHAHRPRRAVFCTACALAVSPYHVSHWCGGWHTHSLKPMSTGNVNILWASIETSRRRSRLTSHERGCRSSADAPSSRRRQRSARHATSRALASGPNASAGAACSR